MEKISSTDRARNEEVLQRVKVDRNILHTISTRKANLICRCYTHYIKKRNFTPRSINSSHVETCPQQAFVPAGLKFTSDLGTNSHLQ